MDTRNDRRKSVPPSQASWRPLILSKQGPLPRYPFDFLIVVRSRDLTAGMKYLKGESFEVGTGNDPVCINQAGFDGSSFCYEPETQEKL